MASLTDTVELSERIAVRTVTRGARPKVVTEFVLTGEADHDAAYTYAINNIPTTVDGLLLNEFVKKDTEAPSVFTFTATYAVDPIPTPNNPFAARGTTRGGKARIFRSLETIGTYTRPGRIAHDYNGAIEVDRKSGEVKGVDVFAKNLEFSWDIYLPAAVFTTTYLRLLYANTPSINSGTWAKGLFKPAECLFMGADWELTKDPNDPNEDLVKLGFYFGGSIEEQITVNDLNSSNPILKAGWHHLWLDWEEEHDATNSTVSRRPHEARVDRIYKWFDFKKLGLGF